MIIQTHEQNVIINIGVVGKYMCVGFCIIDIEKKYYYFLFLFPVYIFDIFFSFIIFLFKIDEIFFSLPVSPL